MRLMVRILQILSGLALVSAGIVFVLCIVQAVPDKPEIEEMLRSPSVAEKFKQANSSNSYSQNETSPLVREAEAFSLYLKPVQAPEGMPAKKRTAWGRITAVRPVVVSPKFKLHGTCYYPSRPEESQALIWEPRVGGGNFQWVKAGTQLGRFVIERIKRGAILYTDGERVREMSVERRPAVVSLVKRRSNSLEETSPGKHTLTAVKADAHTMRNITLSVRPTDANKPPRPEIGDERRGALEDSSGGGVALRNVPKRAP